MAKHNQLIDTIDRNITNGILNNVGHLVARNENFEGNTILIDNNELINFSSYSYLGLEGNSKLKEGCVASVNKYGTQFGFSRAFISIDLYEELEQLLSRIFEAYVVVAPSTTLAHLSAIPVLVGDEDAIIIDQHAHASLYVCIKTIRDRGVKVELVRHNRVDLIEEKIIALKQKYKKIWYVPDGVYSMYGDYAPLKELEGLMNKYEQFHLYVDDAHGMSWVGLNGRGYTLNQIKLHPQMVLVTSLNKAFASAGGALVLPNKEWHRKIRTCGGALIFSTPIPPPMLGIGVASAKLHLTEELTGLQDNLKQKIDFCVKKIQQLNLKEISENSSPIFYLPTSFPKVSYNLTRKMMNEGYYMTPTIFPAVSMRKAGIRFCINVNHSEEQIDHMLSILAQHYPVSLQEEEVKIETIYRSFGIDVHPESDDGPKTALPKSSDKLHMETYETIEKIDKEVWNNLLGESGTFDWDGLLFLEKTFKDNPEKENNWQFYYCLVKDHREEYVLATFFTKCWCKDDIFKPAAISHDIELKRENDPYYLCTESLMMGSLLTEGQHLYLDRSNTYWQEALLLMFNEINNLQLKTQTNTIYLRDFNVGDEELTDLFIANGFVQIDLPDYTHELTNLGWQTTDEFLQPLNSRKRQQLRRDTFRYEDKYEIRIRNKVSEEELEHYYQLYLNVKKGSFIINTFNAPLKVFQNMNQDNRWEMIELSLKEGEYQKGHDKQPIAVVFCYKTENTFIPLLVGLDYRYKFSHKNYKQAVYQCVHRANQLGVKKLYFGITASVEKRRVGAIAIPKTIFVQLQDTYNMEVLELVKARELRD
ncbi:MAG: GNAT family N-acetyltransferase [Flavobacteriales bacterium]|nr:GNAT family N-acetyltransferase [Flavobacteriales bacterium]